MPVTGVFDVEIESIDTHKRNKVCSEVVEGEGPLGLIEEDLVESEPLIRI